MNIPSIFKPWEEQIRTLLVRYGRYIPTIAFLWGLVWDSLTIRRPDSIFENLTVIGYLALSACAIILLNIKLKRAYDGGAPPLLLLGFMQFAFGNLTSALMVLFVKSGTFAGSALFFLVFGALLVGNEFVRDKYGRLQVHIAAWYVLLLSYSIIAIPILIGKIGDAVFVFSVAVSLAIVGTLLAVVYVITTRDVLKRLFHIIGTIIGIAALFFALYFSGTIPPAPLMLEHIGVYHNVTRTAEGDYQATFEKARWYRFFRDTSRTYTHVPGKSIFCASSVFAPARLETPIFHRWEYYDESQKDWVSMARIPFSIRGGRDGGFRGYTEISRSLKVGDWRCSVETARGALIGRFTFTVVSGEAPTELEEAVF
jgi:hypothetical protein